MLTQEQVKEMFDFYDGNLIWRDRPNLPNNWKARWPGRIAGTIAQLNGDKLYVVVCINGVHYLAHKVIWLWAYGEWPKEIDHKNGDGTDNRLLNLRSCTRSQNCANKEPGFGWEKHGRKYRARIKLEGRKIELGSFDTIEEAQKAYLEGRRHYFGEFA